MSEPQQPYQHISAEALRKWIDDGKEMLLIDVLSAESFSARHLPAAVNIPAHEDGFVDRVRDIVEGDMDKTIVVYCSSTECLSSPTAAKALSDASFSNVYDFDDGIAGWEAAGFSFA